MGPCVLPSPRSRVVALPPWVHPFSPSRGPQTTTPSSPPGSGSQPLEPPSLSTQTTCLHKSSHRCQCSSTTSDSLRLLHAGCGLRVCVGLRGWLMAAASTSANPPGSKRISFVDATRPAFYIPDCNQHFACGSTHNLQCSYQASLTSSLNITVV